MTTTIGEIIKKEGLEPRGRAVTVTAPRPSSMQRPYEERKLQSYGLSKAWKTRNPTFDRLCLNYAPAYWSGVAGLGDKVYDRENPALIALNDIYGLPNAANTWLEMQVNGYTTAINERDQTALDMVPLFVRNFVHEVGRYRILEIMLFFSRLVAGRYKIYGRFEPRQIAEAWRKFLTERESEMDAMLSRKAADEREELYRTMHTRLTLDQWHCYKPFMEAGYDEDFYLAYSGWLDSWHYGDYRPPRREPIADMDM